MRIKSRRSRVHPNVDMTPMIDIVFQLILFFLVSTTFAILPGIKMNLPASSTAEGTSSLGITITVSGNEGEKVFFNDKNVTDADLKNELMAFNTGSTKKEDFPVSLEADADVKNGRIVKLFDVIRESGYSVINLRTAAEK